MSDRYEQQLIYVVMQQSKGIVNTYKAYETMRKAKAVARQLNLSTELIAGVSPNYYVEKLFLTKNSTPASKNSDKNLKMGTGG